MKCLLHIGTEKTGTTILQDWLYDNQDNFSNYGIYLSNNLGKTNNRLFPAFFQSFLDDWAQSNRIGSEFEKEKYFDGFTDRLADEILAAKKNHHLFLITSEHLHSRVRNKEEIELIYEYLVGIFDEVEVVCYFRDQFDVAVSLYSTALKVDCSSSIESFVGQAKPENYYYNYLEIADNWSSVFGRENCIFRIYDTSNFPNNDIRMDFLDLLRVEIDIAKLNMDRISSNESLHLLQSVVFRAINRHIPYWSPDNSGVNNENIVAKENALKLESLKHGRIFSDKGDAVRASFHHINDVFLKKYFAAGTSFPISASNPHVTVNCHDAAKAIEAALDIGMNMKANLNSPLSEEEIDSLRDTSLHMFNAASKYKRDALEIMRIALNNRPEGIFIKNKVEQWSAILQMLENE